MNKFDPSRIFTREQVDRLLTGIIGKTLLETDKAKLFEHYSQYEKVKGIAGIIIEGSALGCKQDNKQEADIIVDGVETIQRFFKGLWDNIVSTFTSIGTVVGDAIGGAIKAAINGVLWTVEGALNLIPNAVNGAIDLINKLPGVNISAIPTITLPRLAQGGVLKKGQMGFLEGNGDEAVVPLSQNTEWIDRVADKISEKSGNSATYIFNFNIDNVNGNREDLEENADLLMQIFTEKMSRMGVVFA